MNYLISILKNNKSIALCNLPTIEVVRKFMETQNVTPSDEIIVVAEPAPSQHFFQVDLWKAILIFLVIMDHTFTHAYLHQYASSFWERIAIPMLLVIMGFNMGKSFKRKGYTTIKQLYSLSYFESKFKRYIAPYLVLYGLQSIFYLLEQNTGMTTNFLGFLDLEYKVYIGFTPFYGPGTWFIPALLSTILIFPVLYWCYLQKPALTLIGTFVFEMIWYVMKFYFYNVFSWQENMDAMVTSIFFNCHILNMFSAVGLGLWFSTDHDIFSKRNIWMWSLVVVSVLYMIQYAFLENWLRYNTLFFSWFGGDYHLFFFPYSGFLFLIGMKIFPENPQWPLAKWIRRISNSSYHILMTQIFYFGLIYQFLIDFNTIFDGAPQNYIWFFTFNVIITFCGGMAWNELETRYYKKKRETTTQKNLYKGIIGLSAAFFIIRIILIVLFFYRYPIV